MATEKVKIVSITSIADYPEKIKDGKKIPASKLIKFDDDKGRKLSGFVSVSNFKQDAWAAGVEHDLEVTQNENYTNFRLPKTGGSGYGNKEVLDSLNEVKQMCRKILSKLNVGGESESTDDVPF